MEYESKVFNIQRKLYQKFIITMKFTPFRNRLFSLKTGFLKRFAAEARNLKYYFKMFYKNKY